LKRLVLAAIVAIMVQVIAGIALQLLVVQPLLVLTATQLRTVVPILRAIGTALLVVVAFCTGWYLKGRASRLRNRPLDAMADIAWTHFIRWRESQQDDRRALADVPTQQVLDWTSDRRTQHPDGFTYEVCDRMCSKHRIAPPTPRAFEEAENRRRAHHRPGEGF
jgi:ABC-type nickel/cobalt efflux system permease component RcnA